MEQKSSHYDKSAVATVLMAKQGFFASVSPETEARVSLVLGSMYWVDKYLDDLDDRKKRQAGGNMLTYLNGREPLNVDTPAPVAKVLHQLKDVLADSSVDRRREFIESAKSVLTHGETLSTTTSAKQFVQARAAEAHASADLVLALSPDLARSKPFVSFYRAVTAFGNLVDSIVDARQDKAEGKIAISPSKLYFRAACAALKHGAKAMSHCPEKLKMARFCTGVLAYYLGARGNFVRSVLPEALTRPSENPSVQQSSRLDR